jgi:hypothetical protein
MDNSAEEKIVHQMYGLIKRLLTNGDNLETFFDEINSDGLGLSSCFLEYFSKHIHKKEIRPLAKFIGKLLLLRKIDYPLNYQFFKLTEKIASPIEAEMLIGFLICDCPIYSPYGLYFYLNDPCVPFYPHEPETGELADKICGKGIPILSIQTAINKTNFTSDFRLSFIPYNKDYSIDSDNKIDLLIECDGHEFHDGTPEVAEKTKQRDRTLVKLGYKIIHFSGREIRRNPVECVKECYSQLISLIKEKFGDDYEF